jgi:hypothetical protein
MGLMVVLLTISLGVVALSQTQSNNVIDDGKRLSALSVAEAGVDHIIWRLRQTPDAAGHYGPAWRTMADEQNVTLSSGVYHLSALDTDLQAGVKGLRIQGWLPNRTDPNAVTSEIYAEVAPIYWKPFAGAALGDRGVPVANGNTDSYQSQYLNANGTTTTVPYGSLNPDGTVNIKHGGDVMTNNTAAGSLSVGSQGEIDGVAYYPRGGTDAVVSGASHVTGGAKPNPADTTFRDLPAIPPVTTSYPPPAGYALYLQPYSGGALKTYPGNVTLTQPLAPGTYVFKSSGGNSINISGQDSLQIAGTGQTIFFLEGDLDIGGNGLVNTTNQPTNLIIYGMKAATGIPGCDTIDMHGNGAFHGAIYAPEADITLNGAGSSGVVFGSLSGKTVSINGNGTVIHNDESLRNVGGVVAGYRLNSWTQLK